MLCSGTMPQSALCTKTQSMLNATVVRAFADLLPYVPDPWGSPNAGRGAECGACWGGSEGTNKGLGGGSCPVWGNGIFREKPDGARISLPVLLLSQFGEVSLCITAWQKIWQLWWLLYEETAKNIKLPADEKAIGYELPNQLSTPLTSTDWST